MGNGNEPVYQTEDDRELANNEQQFAEEQGALKGYSNPPKPDDELVATGNIKDGSAFGSKFVIVKHMSSKGNEYMMLYQQVGFVGKSKAGSKTDWRGDSVLARRSQDDVERDKCVMFGYNKEYNASKYTQWDIVQPTEESKQVNSSNDVEFDDDIPF